MWSKEDIRQLRVRLGMSQGKFAENLGVTMSAIQHWELGIAHPSAWEETKLADIENRILAAKAKLAGLVQQQQADEQKSPVKTVLLPSGGSVSTDGHDVYVSEPKK